MRRVLKYRYLPGAVTLGAVGLFAAFVIINMALY